MILELEKRWPTRWLNPSLFIENETGYPLIIYNVKINNFVLIKKKCAGFNMILELEKRWPTRWLNPGQLNYNGYLCWRL